MNYCLVIWIKMTSFRFGDSCRISELCELALFKTTSFLSHIFYAKKCRRGWMVGRSPLNGRLSPLVGIVGSPLVVVVAVVHSSWIVGWVLPSGSGTRLPAPEMEVSSHFRPPPHPQYTHWRKYKNDKQTLDPLSVLCACLPAKM